MTIAHEVEVDRPAANGRGAVGWRPTAGRCEMWARCGVEQNAYDQNINELATSTESEAPLAAKDPQSPPLALPTTGHPIARAAAVRCVPEATNVDKNPGSQRDPS